MSRGRGNKTKFAANNLFSLLAASSGCSQWDRSAESE